MEKRKKEREKKKEKGGHLLQKYTFCAVFTSPAVRFRVLASRAGTACRGPIDIVEQARWTLRTCRHAWKWCVLPHLQTNSVTNMTEKYNQIEKRKRKNSEHNKVLFTQKGTVGPCKKMLEKIILDSSYDPRVPIIVRTDIFTRRGQSWHKVVRP
jgi:hypothetical protein